MPDSMGRHTVSVSASIAAPARVLYDIIADYREGHPRIVPNPPFRHLTVIEGGIGTGTVVSFEMRLLGKHFPCKATVSEPDPGWVLEEAEAYSGTLTRFTVAAESMFSSRVTISSDIPVPGGLLGRVQGKLLTRLFEPIYRRELALLAGVAEEKRAA